ncbi:serine/threonine-protein kinase [Segatella copri]|uniref:serine/threonine-protein kinase n=1 Tax=Segatella copri TaxID=165179 RepID=UPI00258D732E|nr:serine/threonine-protein kinase [Segatella copri]WOF96374.1 serine/threonine-protein kinase [Segatella copri]
MDSYSGIIIEESRRSEQFSDFTPIPCKGFNLLCKAKRYGRWWVLKGLKEPYRQDGNYKNLLHKEFDILISLQHPNIVSAYSMEEIPEMGTCIVMEWIDGITLEHWIGRKTEGEDIFLQLLDAVHYIHAKQIVHRDLKPSNIMITHNGNHVKLIDFGLSDTDDFAILKQPAGTPGYISPEQIVSQQADIRNDIFSIGCILEKMLPGKPYTAIIKRCKAPITQRYANVDELKADFMASRNRHLSGIKRIGIAALVCIILLGFISYPLLHQQEKSISITPAHHETKKDTVIRQQAGEATPLSESKHSQQPAADEPSSASQTQTAELISKGQKAIDKMWKESGIDTIRSVEKKSEAFYRFIDKSNDFITTTYPQTFSRDIAGSKKTDIIYELSSYTTERYVKPTLSRFQSSK